MSIQLEIPDQLFQRIKNNAIPFVDLTPVAVLERWANYFEKSVSPGLTREAVVISDPAESTGRKFDPLAPPNLIHTRCRGTFGKKSFKKWNDLVRIAHTEAFAKAGSFEALLKITHAQLRKGDHTGDSGYHFVPEIGISIQGVDAKKAWEYSINLARYVKTSVVVHIEWRHKEAAAFPGETGTLEWRP